MLGTSVLKSIAVFFKISSDKNRFCVLSPRKGGKSLCSFCDLYVGYRGYEVWDIMTLTRLNLSCIELWDDAFDFFRLSESFRCVSSSLHILHHSAARQTLWVSATLCAPEICQLLIWRNPEAAWMKIMFFFSIVFDIKLRAMEPDPHRENSVFANGKMIKETLMTWEFYNVNAPAMDFCCSKAKKTSCILNSPEN